MLANNQCFFSLPFQMREGFPWERDYAWIPTLSTPLAMLETPRITGRPHRGKYIIP